MPETTDAVPGAQPIGEERTYWVIYDDGSTGQITATGESEPDLTRPGRLVTQEEYEARLEEIRAARAAHLEELLEAEAAQQLAEYRDLRAAGIPDATARRLSGYTGPDPESVGEGED
ncbi:MAG TPA: hypothetical protein VK545_21095 [Streptomyces sp.]|nr:hypothetical protein [Streptomyces sp.]